MISARGLALQLEVWRISFLRSHETFRVQNAPLRPLLVKELWEILSGRALWTMLLLMCPLIGYSFFQAISLYGEASAAGLQSPVLAASLSPLDGVLVPTLGASYVAVTLLFPFVAFRVLGQEKESGALRLLVQLPYRSSTLIFVKLGAVLAAWALVSIPALSALTIWAILGGHLAPFETLNLLFGHLLYGLLIGSIALFAAAISESSATAAIIVLAVTIGSWVLGFTTLAGIWLPTGVSMRRKLLRSAICGLGICAILAAATAVRRTADVTEDRRNSFPAADQTQLSKLSGRLAVTIHLASEDPRFLDLQRNVVSKLERAMPSVTIDVANRPRSDDADRYGEVDYSYAGRSDMSRSTSHREILPLIYGLAGVPPPSPL